MGGEGSNRAWYKIFIGDIWIYMRVMLNVSEFQVMFRMPVTGKDISPESARIQMDIETDYFLKKGWKEPTITINKIGEECFINCILYKEGGRDLLFDGAEKLYWAQEITWAARAVWYVASKYEHFYRKNHPNYDNWYI